MYQLCVWFSLMKVKDSIEVIPPYETPINFEELKCEYGMTNAMKKIANDEYAMSY